MAQSGESSYQPPEPPEDPQPSPLDKKPLEIRLSVFFDGTGNNRGNIQARKNNSPLYQKMKQQNADSADKYSSFESGFSNIAILEEQYKETTECHIHKAFYIEGVATRDIKEVARVYDAKVAYNAKRAPRHRNKSIKLETDSATWGNGLATGSTGLYAKIDKAYREIMFWFMGELKEEKDSDGEDITTTDHEIVKIVVDVFGFSRGAATARHFVHHITKGLRTMVTPLPRMAWRLPYPTKLRSYNSQKKTLVQGIKEKGFTVGDKALEIGFVGLFDTVSSYVIALTSDVKILHLDAIKEARKVYHLAAAEEHRLCFSLTNIKSAKSKGVGEEYFLPGVHSDIGGGYRGDDIDGGDHGEHEQFDLMNNDLTTVGLYNLINRGGRVMGYQEFLNTLADEGWFQPGNRNKKFPYGEPYTREKGEIWIEHEKGYLRDDIALKINRTCVLHEYRRIPLKLMAESMDAHDFMFNPRLKSAYAVPGLLSGIEGKIRSYIGSTSESKPEDWLRNNDPELNWLRNNQLHYSSRVATGHWPRFKQQKRYRQYYEG